MIITSSFIFLFFVAVILTLTALFADLKGIKKTLGEKPARYLLIACILLLLCTLIKMGMLQFQVTLTLLVAGTGVIALTDRLFFHRARLAVQGTRPYIVENAYSFFWVLLLVWVIRSFLIQPYRVPTGSLLPTVTPGDFLVVNQFSYGLHFPIANKKIADMGSPKRGDIALFYYPLNLNMVYVKRVIGLPGDHIAYRNKVLYINGKEMVQKDIGNAIDMEPTGTNTGILYIPVHVKQEDLEGVKHEIYVTDYASADSKLAADFSIDVPAHSYFMMGDNRDNSEDSRIWGPAPEANLIGKAFRIWMNWDPILNRPIWARIGLPV